MFWYKRHLGDYAKKTGHLTVWEHGALTLLLDRFYATEKPLTNSDPHRICRPTSAKEKAALTRLMEEFFTLTEVGYINDRAMREIVAMQEKSLKARKSADTRWKQMQCERNAIREPRTKKTKQRARSGLLTLNEGREATRWGCAEEPTGVDQCGSLGEAARKP